MTRTLPDPRADVGLDAVTEADIRRTLRGNVIGSGGKPINRRKLTARVRAELARLEDEAAPLRAWLQRQEQSV